MARRLVERGHTVRFLGEPCNAEEIQAAGCHFVSYVPPHRRTKSPDDDFVRDWEARTPLDAFARNRQRLKLKEQGFAEGRIGLVGFNFPVHHFELLSKELPKACSSLPL